MRLSYSIHFEDFKALQRPFTLRVGNNAGFKGAMVACFLIAMLGVFCLIQGFGLPVGAFLIGLGVVAAGLAYLYEKRTVAARARKYEQGLESGYQGIHCRDQRTLEVDQNGLTMGCACQTVNRPWSELTSFSENASHFAFGTKMGMQLLPKSAFASSADITEFRALISDRLNKAKLVTSPHFDVMFTSSDYRSARFVHLMKGGGWRPLASAIVTSACATAGCFVIWHYVSPTRDPLVLVGLLVLLVAGPSYRSLRPRKTQEYLAPMRLYFDDNGLFAQYPAMQSRWQWSQFIGYLEDENVLMLYVNPKLYTVIPQRALDGTAAHFKTLVASKMRPYDYRNPVAPFRTETYA